MIKAIPLLLLLPVFLAPLPSHCADIPFGIDLKELERPKSALSVRQGEERKKKERGKKQRRAGRAAGATPAADGRLRHTVKAEERDAPPARTWICRVPEQDPAATVDSLLALLRITPGKNREVQAGRKTETAFTVTAERYFEYQGRRYVVSIGESEPSKYTLLRVLETEGYQVLRLGSLEDFRGTTDGLLRVVGVAPVFGRHLLQEGKGITGFLIEPETAGGKRVVVSSERVEPGEKWPLAPECGAR